MFQDERYKLKKIAPVAALPLVFGLLAAPAAYAAPSEVTDIDDLTLLATTDLHGTLVDYDYFTGQPFGANKPEDARGLDRLSTAIKGVRADKGEESVILLDNGDANQGASIETVYHANRTADTIDPMASAFNYLNYDAVVAGNHEFNYGLEDLSQYIGSLDMPFLAANVDDRETGNFAYDPYTIIEKTTADGHTVNVGVVGVVTPGVPGWDGDKVASLEFNDTVETLKLVVPLVKADGADVVIVLAHTGEDPTDYVWNPADLQENAARSIAQNVSGIDVIVAGHSHVTNLEQKYYTNPDGREVLLTQPGYHARALSEVNIPLSLQDGDVVVDWTDEVKPSASHLAAPDFAQDPEIENVIAPWFEETKDWVGTVVAQSTEEMKSETSAWEDTAILDFVNKVQVDEITRALEGTEYEGLPIVAEVSPFSRTAVFDKGDVTIADMASIYVYDNTLFGIKFTGEQLRDYLEWSARFYIQQDEGAEVEDWSTVTNAQYEGMTRGLPDYTYDVLSRVNYHINISKPVGERIDLLTFPDGTPVQPDDELILALNNYRQSGGSAYPHVKTAPVIYDEQKAIRDLMIEWAQENGTIDPSTFFEVNWSVSTSAAEGGAEEPTETPTDSTETPTDGTDEPTDSTGEPTKPGDSDSSDGTDDSVVEPTNGEGGNLAKTGSSDIFALAGAALAMLIAGSVLVVRRMKA